MLTREVKDSGVEWIGEIPKDWDLKRMKYILSERKIKNDPIITEKILSLSVERGVFPYSEKTGGGNKAKEDLTAYKVAFPNDIVINSMNILAGAVGLSKYKGAVSPVYYTLYDDSGEIDINYYYYLFQTEAFQRSLLGLGNGIMMKESSTGKLNTIRMRIPMEKLFAIRLPIPPKNVQTKIVEFISTKVESVEKIIIETKQSIEELKKYKQSIITEAVTKGLDSDVEMRKVEADYTDSIPLSWLNAKLKHLCTMESGKNLTSEEISTIGKYPVYGANGIRGFYNQYNYKGELLTIGRQGALSGNVHYIDEEFWATDHALVTEAKSIVSTKFLYYLIQGMNLNQYAYNAAQPGISASFILQLPCFLPKTKKEQQEIVSYLDTQTKRIDTLIQGKEKTIKEFEKYKQSLIYEYITGKKEV